MTDAGSRSTRLLSLMDDIGARDMGELTYLQAAAFHEATELVRLIVKALSFEMAK